MRILALLALGWLALGATARADAAPGDATPPALTALPDSELAQVTGKFVLPNGAELALTVTSDTVVNGQLILRTVLAIDHSAQLQVFGRDREATSAYVPPAAATPAGVTILLNRNSIQTLSPTVAVSQNPSVSVGAAVQDPQSQGLSALPLAPGGPAIATADGVVSLQTVQGGSQVNFAGDQLSIVNLVGRAVATAVANSGNDRTIDTVTNIAIDARNLAPYQIASAQIRVDTLVIDAAARMVR